MYTAYILGGGKRIEDAELDNLFRKLKYEQIDIHHPEQLRAKDELGDIREIIIRGNRRLSQHEMINKHFLNPFQPLIKTEDVQIRIIKDSR